MPSRLCMWLKKERNPKGSLHDMKGAPQHLKVGKTRRSSKEGLAGTSRMLGAEESI